MEAIAEAAPVAPLAETAEREAAQVASGYRPSVTWREVEAARRGEVTPDPRDISLGRLFIECRKLARRKGKGLRRSETESVGAEMAMRIVEMRGARGTWHGVANLAGRAPLRREFLDEWGAVSHGGSKLMFGALRASLDAPSLWRETPPEEVPTDLGTDLASLAVLEAREEAGARVVPDASTEELARVLALPESAARVIVAAGSFLVEVQGKRGRTWRVDVGAASAAMGIGADSLKEMLKRGKRQLRERYPDPGALLEALQAGGAATVEMRADHVREAAEWHTATGRDALEVREAARAYVGALEETPRNPWGDRDTARAVLAALKALGAVGSEYREFASAPVRGRRAAPWVAARRAGRLAPETARERATRRASLSYPYASARDDLAHLHGGEARPLPTAPVPSTAPLPCGPYAPTAPLTVPLEMGTGARGAWEALERKLPLQDGDGRTWHESTRERRARLDALELARAIAKGKRA